MIPKTSPPLPFGKRLGGILLAGFLLTVGHAAPQRYSDGLIAIVNDTVITVYDVTSYTAVFPRPPPPDIDERGMLKWIRQERRRVANQLIDEELLHAEFVKAGLAVPNELLAKEIDRFVSEQAQGDSQKFETMLEAQQTTMAMLREKVARRLAVRLLIDQEVRRKIIISPAHVAARYEERRADYVIPATIRFRMLQISKGGAHQKKVAEVAKAVRGKQDFAALVKKYSDGFNSENGGDLGEHSLADLRAEFKGPVGKLAKGQVAGPIDTANATYFLKLTGRAGAGVKALDTVQEAIKDQLYNEEWERRYEGYLSRLREKAYVKKFFQD